MMQQFLTVAIFLGVLCIPLVILRWRVSTRRGQLGSRGIFRGRCRSELELVDSLLLPGGERLYIALIAGERVLLSGGQGKLAFLWRITQGTSEPISACSPASPDDQASSSVNFDEPPAAMPGGAWYSAVVALRSGGVKL